jgi:hypothetical protein
MKLKTALLGVAIFMITGCGDLLGDQTHDFPSGTYAVSSATLASSTDQCGLLGAYTGPPQKLIGITVSGETVTFNLSNSADATSAMKPTATLASNELSKLAEANFTVDWGVQLGSGNCVTRNRSDVIGSVTADNTAELTVSLSASTEAGTCNSTTSGFAAVPCASTYHFIATKQ